MPLSSILITDPGRPGQAISGDEVRPSVSSLSLSPTVGINFAQVKLTLADVESPSASTTAVGVIRVGGSNLNQLIVQVMNAEQRYEQVDVPFPLPVRHQQATTDALY